MNFVLRLLGKLKVWYLMLKNKLFLNKKGNRKECYICKNTFNNFTKYRGGFSKVPQWSLKLDVVGSDLDNFGCIYCNSSDRERHLFMFFDKLNLWNDINNSNILHFAPEINLSIKISTLNPKKYVKADLYPSEESIQKIDITKIPYKDETFDLLICNHVLEHVPDYMKALKEINRVLKPNGIAILQTPYSKLLQKNFEDEGIDNDDLRLLYYGQEDHVRYFSEKQFFNDIEETGFNLQIVTHDELPEKDLAKYYGVNVKEDLIRAVKPS